MDATAEHPLVLCDAHVHIYDCFDLNSFLGCAWKNFQAAADDLGCRQSFSAALLFSEASKDHWFRRISEASVKQERLAADWAFSETGETESVLATGPGNRRLLLVAGRQIVTSENLEVLALATPLEFPDGDPIADVVSRVRESGGIAVVPWGFGKWWGKRGKILSALLDNTSGEDFFLGDNGGRPWFMGNPQHMDMAMKNNRRILPGTDPLPFPSENCRPGGAGFSYSNTGGRPLSARSIREALLDSNVEITGYMKCEKFFPFWRNQIAMQTRKHFR